MKKAKDKITTMTFQLPLSVKQKLKQLAVKKQTSMTKLLVEALSKVK